MDDIARESSYATPYANSTFLPMLLLSLAIQKNAPKTKTSFKNEYDYIIVGAGSAGSTVASRLSEIRCVSVLLLEAGKLPPVLSDIPAIGRSFINSDIDWRYLTESQKHSGDALTNNKVVWPCGKVVGGSSIFNDMLYVRGNHQNYEDWAAGGATGWSYREVLRYFKKMENNQNPESIDREFHGFDGPITVEKPRYRSKMRAAALEAARSVGIPIVDSNGRQQLGSYDFQATTRRGQRCSTAKAYLVPAENRTNLDILPNAHVTKILFKNRRATGVQFDFNGKKYEVKARREVILSAGTVNTAQILMMSGIGPKATLDKFQIPVVEDLPVGLNLQDHVYSFLAYEVKNGMPFMGKLIDDNHIKKYIKNRRGPLTSCEGVANILYLPLEVPSSCTFPRNTNHSVLPNFNIFIDESALTGLVQSANVKPEVYDKAFRAYENKTIIFCMSAIMHPKSRGYVGLRSADPYDSPIIDPNYYEKQKDVNDVAAGLKFCKDFMQTEPMQRIGVRSLDTRLPGCDSADEQYLSCVAKTIILSANHPVGTAKMGDSSDRTTVVDPLLRVKNVRGLRVVDASVMPIIPSANTNVPTIMVAEKASDMIKSSITC